MLILLALLVPLIIQSLPHAQASPSAAGYQRYFERYTELYWADVPFVQWPLLESVAWAESGFRPDAQSPAGAKGILQITDSTLGDLIPKLPQLPPHPNPFDPEISIMAGTYYLRFGCWNFWINPRPPAEQTRFALASYNAGPGNINRAWTKARQRGLQGLWRDVAGELPAITGEANARQTTGYVAKILPRYERRVAELRLGPAGFVREAIHDLTGYQPSVSPTPMLPPAADTKENIMENALSQLGATSLPMLLMHQGGYKVVLFIIAVIALVFIPPYAYRRWDRVTSYDTSAEIAGGSRLVTIFAIVQTVGVYAIIIIALLLLH